MYEGKGNLEHLTSRPCDNQGEVKRSWKDQDLLCLQVLAWRDGGWEKDAADIEDIEEQEFLVCSSNEDGDNTLILGTPMELEDALITCQVEEISRQISKGMSHTSTLFWIIPIKLMSRRFYKGQALTSRTRLNWSNWWRS